MTNVKIKNQIIAGVFCYVICIIIYGFFGTKELVYDSLQYWQLGENFWSSGKFNFIDLYNAWRGYVFPLWLGICNHIGGIQVFQFLNAACVSVLFAIILPKVALMNETYDIHTIVSCIICMGIFCVFFYGLIVYPLSDVPAMGVSMICVVFMNRLEEDKRGTTIWAFLLGFGIYIAYNIRTIYMFFGIYMFGAVLYIIYKKRVGLQQKVTTVLSMIGGIIMAGLPQVYLNYFLLDKVSFKVPTDNLMVKQLFWGIKYQRYDTFIDETQRIPQMIFTDPVGVKLLEEEGMEILCSWNDYFHLIFKYPLEICGIYIRHFISILLPIWSNQYVKDVNNNKIFLTIFAFSILYFWVFVSIKKMWKNIKVFKNFIPLIIPSIFILPGAVEVRFFVTMWLMIIAMICFCVQWNQVIVYAKNHKLEIILSYIVIFAVMVSFWSMLLASESVSNIFFESVR